MKHRIKRSVNNYIKMSFMDSVALNRKCGLNLLAFELLYKLAAIAVFYPLFVKGFEFTLQKAGFRYLTNSYFYVYLKSPYTIAFFLLTLILFSFYITFEVACLSVCYDSAHHGKALSVPAIFKSGFKLIGSILKRKKRFNTFFHIVSVSIMMNITLIVFLLINVTLPYSATNWLDENKIVLIIAGVLLFIFFIYCMIHIFIMNFMAYGHEDISECKRKSRQLVRDRGIKTFMTILGLNAIVLLGIFALYCVLVIGIWSGVFILDKVNMGMAIYLSVFRVVLTLFKILMILVSLPLCYGVITALFFRYRCDMGEEFNIGDVTGEIIQHKLRFPKVQKIICNIIIVISLVVNVYYLITVFERNPFEKVELFSNTEVMAHRGCSYNAPENTMLAFENAVDSMADYIELDVHETRDGEIVVIHDSSLRRTTDLTANIWDVSYEEIKDVDAGSYFGDDEAFAECTIPTLREVMEYTGGKIKLNIEIKLSDKEPHLVQKVAELIEEFEYKEDCYVTSMNYDALKQIKAIDENIKTGYVLTIAYGNFYNLDYCDAFSINSAYVNKKMVDAIHNRGKKIFVWTVNSSSKAKEMTEIGVDAIITDNPVMTREIVYSKYNNPLFKNVLDYVFR